MSALVVCLICDRQRHVFDPHGIGVCSNCGVTLPRIIRDPYEWQNSDGLSATDASRRAYAGLKWIRDNKGYKPKWADARYRAIFGCWPPREIADVPAEPPTQGLLRRIWLDNQKWKKAKRAEERQSFTIVESSNPAEYNPPWMTPDDWSVKL